MTNRTIFSLKTKFNVLTFINPFFNEWIEFNYYSDLVIILKKNRDSVLVCEDSSAFFVNFDSGMIVMITTTYWSLNVKSLLNSWVRLWDHFELQF